MTNCRLHAFVLFGDDTNFWVATPQNMFFCLTEVTRNIYIYIKTVLGFIVYIGNLYTGAWNPYESYLKTNVWLKNTYGICG